MGDIYPRDNEGLSKKAYNNFSRVVENVRIAQENGVSEKQIDAYLESEGYSRQRFIQAYEDAQKAGGKITEAGFGSTLANSLLFNVGDDILAAINAARGKGTYEQNVASYNLALGEYARQYPGRALAAEGAGIALPVLATLGAAAIPRTGTAATAQAARLAAPGSRAIPLITRAKRAAGVGAVSGGISGFGASRPGDRTAGTVGGTTIGALAGPATVVGLEKVLLPGGKKLIDLLSRTLPGGAGRAAKAESEAITQAARDKFTAELTAAGYTTQQALDLLVAAEASGVKGAQLADVIPQLQALRSRAASKTGSAGLAAKKELSQRQRQSADNLAELLSQETGSPRIDTVLAQHAVKLKALDNTGPLYDSIRQGSAFSSPELSAMFKKTAVLKDALKTVKRAMTTPKYKFQSNPKTGIFSPAELLKIAKHLRSVQGDLFAQQVNGTGSKAGIATQLDAVNAAIKELDAVVENKVPQWGTANRQWSQAMEVRDAFELGRGFINATDEDAFKRMQELSKFTNPEAKNAFDASLMSDFNDSMRRSVPVAEDASKSASRTLDTLQLDRMEQGFGRPLPTFREAVTQTYRQDLSKQQLQSSLVPKPESIDANVLEGGVNIPRTMGEAKDALSRGLLNAITEESRIKQNAAVKAESEKLTEMFNVSGASATAKLLRDLDKTEQSRVGGILNQRTRATGAGISGGGGIPTISQQPSSLSPSVADLEARDARLAAEQARLEGLLSGGGTPPPANETATDAGNVYGRPPGMSDEEWNAILKKRGLLN